MYICEFFSASLHSKILLSLLQMERERAPGYIARLGWTKMKSQLLRIRRLRVKGMGRQAPGRGLKGEPPFFAFNVCVAITKTSLDN